jgi:ATP-binding cassette subfamily F protein uup
VTSVIAYNDEGKWVNYAGGYSDMVAQRGHGVLARANKETASAPKPAKVKEAATSAAPRKKLGFKEKHALETLPKKLEALRADVQRLQSILADSSLFARDPAAFQKAIADLGVAQAAVTAGEDQWLELEMLREEIEG